MQLLGVAINLALKIVMCLFPPFPLSLHFIPVLKRQDMFLRIMIYALLHLHVIHFYPTPPNLSLSWVLDGGLSPSKNHYSNFLCNMNDSDPLFILELLITPQPIAYPPRQASHSHSRHYFIKRARLQWAFMNNAVIRCGACNGWAHHQRREQDGFHCCLEVNHLLLKGRDVDIQQ